MSARHSLKVVLAWMRVWWGRSRSAMKMARREVIWSVRMEPLLATEREEYYMSTNISYKQQCTVKKNLRGKVQGEKFKKIVVL